MMGSRANAVLKRIAGLSELLKAAQANLASLGEEHHKHVLNRAANLQKTISLVERELGLAWNALERARAMDAAEVAFASDPTKHEILRRSPRLPRMPTQLRIEVRARSQNEKLKVRKKSPARTEQRGQ
jgi:hypothetical protein